MSVIKKIKQESKKANVFGLGGLVVAAGLALAFKPDSSVEKHQDDVLWGRTSTGAWVQTTLTQNCSFGPNICKEWFPQDYNPNEEDDSIGVPQGTQTGYVPNP